MFQLSGVYCNPHKLFQSTSCCWEFGTAEVFGDPWPESLKISGGTRSGVLTPPTGKGGLKRVTCLGLELCIWAGC